MAELNNGNPPPSMYDTAARAEAGDAPPPYESLYGRIRATHAESPNPINFLQKVFGLLYHTIACTVVSVLILGIPIAMVVIGAIHKDDCPKQKYIPIFLIVGGSVGLARNLLFVAKNKKGDGDNDDNNNDDGKSAACILDIFLFAWLITGSVWVYKNYEPEYKNKDSKDYCNETIYKFSFGFITAHWSLIALCCCCCCAVIGLVNITA